MGPQRTWQTLVAVALLGFGAGCADAPIEDPPSTYCQLDRCALMFTEVLAAPKTGGGAQEYVELYNPGTRDLDLRGCTLQLTPGDGRAKRHIIPIPDSPDDPGPLKVPAGGYLLLGPEDADPARVGYRWKTLGNLPNSSTKGVHVFELLDGTGERTTITRLSYLAPDLESGLGAPASAVSFQLGAEVLSCPEGESWDAWCPGDRADGEENRGTPGRANTRCVLPRCGLAECDVLITELMVNPAGADGPNEYVELHNPGAEAVDLAFCALELQKGASDPERVVLRWPDPELPLEVPAGGFVVLRSPLPGDAEPQPGVYRWDALGNLPNSSAGGAVSVRLLSEDDEGAPLLVAELQYLTPAGEPGLGVPDEGRAFQLDVGAFECQAAREPTSWCLAAAETEGDDLGTPGAPNEECPWVPPPRICPLTEPHQIIINEVLPDPSTDDPLNEYVELFNTTGEPIDLSGCVLELLRGRGEEARVTESWALAAPGPAPAEEPVEPPQLLIPGGGFLLLTPPDAGVPGCDSAGWDASFGNLPNTSADDAVTLRLTSRPADAAEAFVVSSFTYLAPAGEPGMGAPVSGASFQLYVDTLAACVDDGSCAGVDDSANWGLSEASAGENLGTPCAPNGHRPPPTPRCGLRTEHELLITEVLADPKTDDPLNEYIEVYNPGAEPVDLRGCDIQLLKGDPASAEPESHRIRNRVADEPIAVPAGGYLLLVPPEAAPEGCAAYAWQELGNLPNSSSSKPVTLRLVSQQQDDGPVTVITSFSYLHEEGEPGLGAPRSGASFQLCLELLEECAAGQDCAAVGDPASWGLGVRSTGENLGTPCADNSDCWRCVPWDCAGGELAKRLPTAPEPCDVVITEVYADAPSDQGNERNLEWFELVNVSDATVDLRGLGLYVRDASAEPDFVFEDGLHCYTLPAGCRVQVLSNPDPALNGGYESLFDYDGDLTLRNSDGYLALRGVPEEGVEGPPPLVDAIRWEETRPGESVNLSGACQQTCLDNDEADCLCLMAPSPEEPNVECPLVEPGECLDPVSGLPRTIVTPRGAELLITEVLPTGAAGEPGFIELYGAGERTVDVNGLRLQVNFGEVETLRTGGVTCLAVAPGARVLLGQRAEDGEPEGDVDGSFAAPLTDGRLEIWLRPPDGVWDVDVASFDAGPGAGLAHVLSESELEEDGRWCSAEPTPRAPNPVCPLTCWAPGDAEQHRPVVHPEPGQLRFTEVLNNPEGVDGGAEWIELTVAYGGPVDVNELRLSINGADPQPLQISNGICSGGAAGQRIVLAQDPDALGERVGFAGTLTNTNLDLVLYLPDGATVLDRTGLLLGDPGSGVAWTLHEDDDGLGDRWCTAAPSRGARNPACPAPPAQCVDGVDGPQRDVQAPATCHLVISEVQPNGADELPTGWIELLVAGDDPVDLNGLLLQIGDAEPEPLQGAPECVAVAAGERAVLVQSLTPEDNGGIEGGALLFAGRLRGDELQLRLLASDGLTIIDEATLPGAVPAPGEARALDSDSGDCATNDGIEAWCALPASPGDPNAACPRQCTDPDGSLRPIRSPVGGQLLLAEVHNNPDGVDGDREWIELVVGAGAPADLNGVQLSVNAAAAEELTLVAPGCRPLVPGERLVLVQNVDPLHNGGFADGVAVFDANLTNAQLTVTLLGPDGGTELDAATLVGDPGAGVSWARHEDLAGLGDRWCPSAPTRGLVNAECPPGPGPEVPAGQCLPAGAEVPRPFLVPEAGAVIFSEVLANPAGEDAGREWLELYVVGAGPYDLNGLEIQLQGGSSAVLQAPSTACVTVQTGEWVLVAQGDDPAANGGLPAPALIFAGALADAGLDLRLLAPGGGLIDGFDYAPPTVEGQALQLDLDSLDEVSNDDPLAWCVAGGAGTPGVANVACDQ